mmetsp:Transcript_20678/g.45372  ORF Transcript_20678/g.45372 Transcript_20678/m.45372 type:complete len:319 (-) Transcript_20678:268-1224(-)
MAAAAAAQTEASSPWRQPSEKHPDVEKNISVPVLGDTEDPAQFLQFRRWSVFLPRAVSSEVEQSTVYVRARHMGNPQFFEQTRQRLGELIHSRELERLGQAGTVAMGMPHISELQAIFHAQYFALGFLGNGQFHKALTLCRLCVQLVDALASDDGPLFWRLLCRANLGGAYARFGKYEEAREVLKEALALAGEPSSAREGALVGTFHAYLGRIELESGDINEALRIKELEIEVFERFLWDLSDARADREVEALVLATSFSNRGICDVHKKKFDTALMWYGRAQECLQKHCMQSSDSVQHQAKIKAYMEHARSLQLLQA